MKSSEIYSDYDNSDVYVDGEDYAVALHSLEQKYGYDEDIITIIKMCSQWKNSFHKIESKYFKLIMEITAYEARIHKITEE